MHIEDKYKYIHHKNNYCSTIYSNVLIKYPKENSVKQFVNHERCEKIRYVQLFDFEALGIENMNTLTNKKEKNHHPISYSQIIIDTVKNEIISESSYVGEDCVDVFLDHTLSVWGNITSNDYPLQMSERDQLNHDCDSNCLICNVEFNDFIKSRRHHDHYQDGSKDGSNYLGALCNSCNLRIKKQVMLVSIAITHPMMF